MFFGPVLRGARGPKTKMSGIARSRAPLCPQGRSWLRGACLVPHAGAGASLPCATGLWSTRSARELPFEHVPRLRPWERCFFCQNDSCSWVNQSRSTIGRVKKPMQNAPPPPLSGGDWI